MMTQRSLLFLDVADLIGAVHVVSLILELDGTGDLVVEGPEEGVVEHVALVVECDLAAVAGEGDSLAADHF